tara:strand:+ start:1239 stop:1943 length:705 start_codon:yes stop_codon:yes gene_type:complete
MHKILIGCESSGTVRDAFQERGFDAWSCDIKPSETPTNSHLQMDVRQALREQKWDMLLVCHPPCTMLCNSGVRWLQTPPPGQTLADRWQELKEGARLFRDLMDADIPAIAVENPVMHKYAKKLIWGSDYERACKDDGTFIRTSQHPYQFAESVDSPDNQKKLTHFWIKNLPPLIPTGTLTKATARDDIHKAPPGPDRSTYRSRFHVGMAKAISTQWGNWILENVRPRARQLSLI